MDNNTAAQPQTTPATPVNEIKFVPETKIGYSNIQPLFNLAVLFVIVGLYHFYWYGVNWRLLSKYKNYRIAAKWKLIGIVLAPSLSYLLVGFTAGFKMPAWLAISSLSISMIAVFLVYSQLKDIRDLATEKSCEVHHYPAATAVYMTFVNFLPSIYLIPLVYGGSSDGQTFWFAKPPINALIILIFMVLNLSLYAFLLLAQKTLNGVWEKEQSSLPVKENFSKSEIILLIIAFLAGWGITGQILSILKIILSV